MSDDLYKSMSKCSDGELVRRLQNEKDYTPEALGAMRSVLRERGYTDTEVGELGQGTKSISEVSSQTEKTKYPAGIGGWLAVYLVVLLIGLTQNVFALTIASNPAIVLMIIIGILLQIVLLIGLFQKKPGYPMFAKWTIGVYGAIQMYAQFAVGNPIFGMITGAGTAMWVSYFNSSRRVRATFGGFTDEEQQLFCVECGEPVTTDTKYCSECGGQFGGSDNAPKQA